MAFNFKAITLADLMELSKVADPDQALAYLDFGNSPAPNQTPPYAAMDPLSEAIYAKSVPVPNPATTGPYGGYPMPVPEPVPTHVPQQMPGEGQMNNLRNIGMDTAQLALLDRMSRQNQIPRVGPGGVGPRPGAIALSPFAPQVSPRNRDLAYAVFGGGRYGR